MFQRNQWWENSKFGRFVSENKGNPPQNAGTRWFSNRIRNIEAALNLFWRVSKDGKNEKGILRNGWKVWKWTYNLHYL